MRDHNQPYKEGTVLEVVADCYCEHYLHEAAYYPRKGLKVMKLSKGDFVRFKELWSNLVGGPYCRVTSGGLEYDILPKYLKRYDKETSKPF